MVEIPIFGHVVTMGLREIVECLIPSQVREITVFTNGIHAVMDFLFEFALVDCWTADVEDAVAIITVYRGIGIIERAIYHPDGWVYYTVNGLINGRNAGSDYCANKSDTHCQHNGELDSGFCVREPRRIMCEIPKIRQSRLPTTIIAVCDTTGTEPSDFPPTMRTRSRVVPGCEGTTKIFQNLTSVDFEFRYTAGGS
jgi:hypothetical protein